MIPGDDVQRELELRLLLHRRRFLGLLAAGTGALVLGACSTDGGSDGGSDGSEEPTPMVPPATGIDASPFALGVASGDPLATSVVLWTRLVVDPIAADGSGGVPDDDLAVRWEVADDEAFEQVVAAGIEPAPAELGHSVHVIVDDLEPDRWYWYRFRIGEFTSPVGRTRTAPAEGAAVDELILAFASCQLRTAGAWSAYPHLVADEPDLVLFLGDYIYEYPGGEGETAAVITEEPQTLADYRLLYGAYKRDAGLQAAHAVAPWIVTWDDHEVENNYAASIPEKDEDAATFDTRRRAAYQAFWEHHPVRFDPPADDGEIEVYRSVPWGSLAEIFVLDGRQHRSDQVCGDELGTNRNDCPEIDDEAQTMLGAEQEAWLTEGLTSTDATWKVLAQQTVMKALTLGDIVLNVDQWDGYPAARARLLTTIEDEGIENVVVLTGDIHAAGATDLRAPDAGLTGPVVAAELVATSISSPGVDALGSIDLSPLGLAYANFSDHGYARCTVTPEVWRCDFVVVDSLTDGAGASVDATVEIDEGTPGVRRV